MRFQRVVAEAVAALMGLAVVAGCSSSPPEPEPLPEPTRSSAASSSPSPGPTATPPTLPAEAEGTSPAAAKAFARYYIELVNYAAATGDTQPARQVSSARCQSCNGILGKVDEIYSSGGRLTGEGWRVRNMKYQPFQPEDRPVLSVGIRISPQVMVSRAGASPTEFPGGRNQLDIRLAHTQEGWTVTDFERLS